MKDKETVLYDNTADYEKEDETREYLFDTYADEEGWECKEEISDKQVQDEIAWQNEICWEDLKIALMTAFEKDCYLMTGTCGRWDGTYDGGNFIRNFGDFLNGISHLDYLKVTDRNGHLIVEGYHHDGSDRYELKKLTRKGVELAESNYYAHDRGLHNTIMTCNLYSALPRIAERVYGI